jgi:MtfA peptidase
MVLAAWRRWRDRRTLATRPIPHAMWQSTLARYAFLAALPPDDAQRLRDMATLFLAEKEFTGVDGLEMTDDMAVAIAAQACLPVLNLGLHWYDSFVTIVLHADEVVAAREVTDESGVVHQYEEALVGEAMGDGPMMLSWRGVTDAAQTHGAVYNVVIHEFAHVIELRRGAALGMPPLPDAASREHWQRVIEASHLRLIRRLDAGIETLLDPYGAESVSEFFAVACEGFFVAGAALRDDDPYLYELLKSFFRQDPAERAP